MPRRRRGFIDHACYHITHRCHKREFLLKFSSDRDQYLRFLRETKEKFRIDVLDYVITSNHVHLLIWSRKGSEIARAMQYLQGRFGQYYNQRKKREGAFWTDRYHSTLIEDGSHLSRCMFYIAFNMIRAGVARHPEDWKHSGYHELVGERQRYRIINLPRFLNCLMVGDDVGGFRKWYESTIDHELSSA